MVRTNNTIDRIVKDLFTERWCGDSVLHSLANMNAQLYKTLTDQLNGYWSGHTAYYIAVDRGFLVNCDRKTPKKLTSLGEIFMMEYDKCNTQKDHKHSSEVKEETCSAIVSA